MSQPAPRSAFDTDEDYWKAFWEMSEFGVDPEDYDFFHAFFVSGLCPQTDEENLHWINMPENVTVYRGFCKIYGRLDGMSWTPDKNKATWFARRHGNKQPILARARINKNEIAVVIIGREEEYIIPDISCFNEDSLTEEEV